VRPPAAALASFVCVGTVPFSALAIEPDRDVGAPIFEPAGRAARGSLDHLRADDDVASGVVMWNVDPSATTCSDDATLCWAEVASIADADGDGVPNAFDDCPDRADPDQLDGDRDGVGDACDNCAEAANPDQANTFGAADRGDACDCPCFTADDVVELAAKLGDASTYREPVCVDARSSVKPLMALSVRRLDGAPCAAASADCSALAVEFTEDRVCQWNPPAPARGIVVQGIEPSQREACRRNILSAAAGLSFWIDSCRGMLTAATAEGLVCQ
jgi:hypothetical protein